ncbi:Ger(x)C family spore germination protein [Halalkalibacter sp. AB-rgal2]|uniref:Ger(x)C family spore germination protein n=1 Tax=Halalkalibacter sp. AB-rgal2 TaxID=3242695 RepID=UPI00359CF5C2
MRKKNVFISIFLTCVVLTGCWDSNSLELQYYVNSIGFDYTEGQYEVFIQILNFQAMPRGGEGVQQSGSPLYVGHAKGRTVVEALHKLYSETDRKIYWGHLSSFIVTKSILERNEGMEEIIEGLSRYEENRHTMWVFATDSQLKELLTTPVLLEMSPIFSVLGEPTESYEQSSFVEPIRLHRLFSLMYEPGQTTIFPILDTREDRWSMELQQPETTLTKDGAALLHHSQFKGFIMNGDMLGMRWMQESTVRASIVLNQSGDIVGTVIGRKPTVKIKPVIQNDNIVFSITIDILANPMELYKDVSSEEIKEMVSKQIENEVRHTFMKALEIQGDIYQLSHVLYKKDRDLWRKYTIDGYVPLNEQSIEKIQVNVKLFKSGKDKLEPI